MDWRATLFFPPAVLRTGLIFATVLTVARSWAASGAAGVQESTVDEVDVFSSLDGFGSVSGGDWGGYWGKQGPELLDHRSALHGGKQRMVFGGNTYRAFARMVASRTEGSEVHDAWVTRMMSMPTTVVSTTLE